jgi:hypothetical protein
MSTIGRRNKMENNILMVFTRGSVEKMLRQGGSASWKLNEKRAGKYSYLICVRNNPGNKEDVEPTGQAFLIAKIKDIVRSPNPDYPDRHMIAFDQYAELNINEQTIRKVWSSRRNPVFYGVKPEDLGLDIGGLKFKKNKLITTGYENLNEMNKYLINLKKISTSQAYSPLLKIPKVSRIKSKGRKKVKTSVKGLTIEEAKQGLAKTFSLDEDDIEIIIRG